VSLENGQSIVQLREASIALSDHRSLKVDNWTLLPGEFWVVGGLNWTGKTEWLMTAAGLQPVGAGQQSIFGTPLTRLTSAERIANRRRMGFVFEHTGRLFAELSVAENVMLPLRYQAEADAATLESRLGNVMEICGIRDLGEKPPTELSRGVQRRAGLARALILEPEVLFLDTPLIGLDPVHARWWLDLLRRFHAGESFPIQTPNTIVVTVEDFRPWLQPGREFAMLDSGNLVRLGQASTVRRCEHRVVQEMLA
tara:strand:+ start:1173 stop:1934 length:762 start_codon:yes stop_codon:yes gene_type:complete